jgi:hypothetical protein
MAHIANLIKNQITKSSKEINWFEVKLLILSLKPYISKDLYEEIIMLVINHQKDETITALVFLEKLFEIPKIQSFVI